MQLSEETLSLQESSLNSSLGETVKLCRTTVAQIDYSLTNFLENFKSFYILIIQKNRMYVNL